MKTARVPDPLPPSERPTRFSHLVIKTDRWEEMVAWYKTVLNARPMFENEIMSFLTFDEEHHRLLIGKAPGAPPRDPAAVGVVHFAFIFDAFDHLLRAYARLRDLDIQPHHCLNHGFTTSIYYRDPDDNEVELAVDNFDSFDAMNDWFATGAFDRNLVGVSFDPEDLLKRQREGEALGPYMQESYE
jgi:catechol-2,3-dioxygenase